MKFRNVLSVFIIANEVGKVPSSVHSWNKTTMGNTLQLISTVSNQEDRKNEGGRRVKDRRRGTEQE